MQQHVVRTITIRFHSCNLDGRRKRRRGVIMIPPRVAMDRRRAETTTDPGVGLPLGSGITPGPGTQGGGGGGAVSTVSPQRTITDDVSQTVERSGGGPCLSSPGVWTECVQRTMPDDIQIQECPHDDDLEIQPRADMVRRLEDGMPAKRIVSPHATPMPVPPADRPQLGPWLVAVVRVEETPRGRCFQSGTPLCYNGEGRLIYLKLLEMMVQFCWPGPPPPPPELV